MRLPRHQSRTDLCELFGQHFHDKIASIRAELDSLSPPDSGIDTSSLPVISSPLSLFSPVSTEELINLIQSCPSKTSSLDPIPTSLLRQVCITLAPSLTAIINASLSSGHVPTTLKTALVIPLLKKPSLDPDVLDNYRPISLLPFLSKLLERVVLQRLLLHLIENELFTPFQSAYRAGHSTETALLKVVNDLLLSIDEGGASLLTLLDLSAAFDTVDHRILLNRLKSRFGISGVALQWFRSYLTDRRQSICISDTTSSPRSLEFGVPQGSVLGPILFLLYIAPVHDIFLQHGINDHFFADDTQGYTKFKVSEDGADQMRASQSMTACIKDVSTWFIRNRLKLNHSKTLNMFVSSSTARKQPFSSHLLVGDVLIPPSNTVTDLGVSLDSHLTMEAQVRNICKRSYYQLWRISKIRKFLDMASCNQLVCSLVLPHLDYANSLLFGLPDYLIAKLQRVQNSAARIVTRAPRRSSSSLLLKRLHWLPVAQRITYKIALLSLKCVNGLAPSYLCDIVSLYCPNRPLRSASSNDLRVPRMRLSRVGERSFTFAAPTVWNSLPPDLRSRSSLESFSSGLKTYLFKLAFSTVT